MMPNKIVGKMTICFLAFITTILLTTSKEKKAVADGQVAGPNSNTAPEGISSSLKRIEVSPINW